MDGLKVKYFVLKPGGKTAYHKASRAAIRKYAESIEFENPQMAEDLRDWVDTILVENL